MVIIILYRAKLVKRFLGGFEQFFKFFQQISDSLQNIVLCFLNQKTPSAIFLQTAQRLIYYVYKKPSKTISLYAAYSTISYSNEYQNAR